LLHGLFDFGAIAELLERTPIGLDARMPSRSLRQRLLDGC